MAKTVKMVRNRKPKALVLRTAGTNCDVETAFAFGLAGAEPELTHINELISGRKKLSRYHIMVIPGGFTYGDDIASGKILANELKFKLRQDIERFIKDKKPIIGICNGFQMLVKSGLLPGFDCELRTPDSELKIQATLTLNDSGKFEDRWVYLKSVKRKAQNAKLECVWTRDLPETIYLPVAHGEGKFIPKDEGVRQNLWNNGQVVLQYVDEKGKLAGYPANPNGSVDNIAGICDTTGRIFGLMPHPERHVSPQQHPRRGTMDDGRGTKKEGDGLQIFRNAIEYARINL